MSAEKQEAQEVAKTEEPMLVRLDALATAAGLLPESFASGVPSRPVAQNPKFWLYRAICVRFRWNEHTLLSQQDFDAAIQAVANFSV